MRERTIHDHFRDWEAEVFGYGYGTGEPHVLAALKGFLQRCDRSANGAYDYEGLEAGLTPTVAWLMINVLAGAQIIEFGTSPRYGWLTPQGLALKAYIDERAVEDLEDVLAECDEDGSPLIGCHREHCNCGPKGYSPAKICHNPFWTERGQK